MYYFSLFNKFDSRPGISFDTNRYLKIDYFFWYFIFFSKSIKELCNSVRQIETPIHSVDFLEIYWNRVPNVSDMPKYWNAGLFGIIFQHISKKSTWQLGILTYIIEMYNLLLKKVFMLIWYYLNTAYHVQLDIFNATVITWFYFQLTQIVPIITWLYFQLTQIVVLINMHKRVEAFTALDQR